MNCLEIAAVLIGGMSGFSGLISALLFPEFELNSVGGLALEVLYFFSIATCFRDIYLRRAVGSNTKLVWCLVIVLLGPIGLLVYLYKFGIKNRGVELVT